MGNPVLKLLPTEDKTRVSPRDDKEGLALTILKTGKLLNELKQKRISKLQGELNKSFPGLWVCIISTSTTYNDTLIKRSVEPDYRTEKSKTHVKIHNPLLQHDAKMQQHTNPSCCVVTEKLLNLSTDPIFIQIVLQPYLTKAPQHTAQLHTQEHKKQHFVCVFYQTKQNFF